MGKVIAAVCGFAGGILAGLLLAGLLSTRAANLQLEVDWYKSSLEKSTQARDEEIANLRLKLAKVEKDLDTAWTACSEKDARETNLRKDLATYKAKAEDVADNADAAARTKQALDRMVRGYLRSQSLIYLMREYPSVVDFVRSKPFNQRYKADWYGPDGVVGMMNFDWFFDELRESHLELGVSRQDVDARIQIAKRSQQAESSRPSAESYAPVGLDAHREPPAKKPVKSPP